MALTLFKKVAEELHRNISLSRLIRATLKDFLIGKPREHALAVAQKVLRPYRDNDGRICIR